MFGRANYLVAAELGSPESELGEPRNYRLDGSRTWRCWIAAPPRPEIFSLSDYASRSFGIYQGEVQEIVLKVAPEAAEDALGWRFHPSQVVEPQPDGSVVVRFWATGLLELAWHLFTWGDRVEVVAPDELRAILVRELERVLARHKP